MSESNFNGLETMVESFLNNIMMQAQEVFSFPNINTPLLPRLTMTRSIHRIMEESLRDINPYKRILSPEGEQQLLKVQFNADMQNTQCPITFKKFEIGEYVIMLPCEHIFEEISIKKWLRENLGA